MGEHYNPGPGGAMGNRGSTSLNRIERCKTSFEGTAATKLALLADLEVRTLRTPREIRRLHDVLCFLRAYPDDRSVLAQVERMLAGFETRSDFRRHRAGLAD